MTTNGEKIIRFDVTLRTASAADEEFSEAVYADSRRAELAALGWSRAAEDAFFKMQFQMQKNAYRMQFPAAVYSIIEAETDAATTSVGRVIIECRDREARLIDIAVLGEYRNCGIGARVIEKLKAENRFLFLRVLKINEAARRFYERHGLTVVEDAELYFGMRWSAADGTEQEDEK